MKKTNTYGYKFNHAEKMIIMNYKFSAAIEIIGSEEYEIFVKLRKDFPDYKFDTKSGRTQKAPRPDKRLTYENMKKYIRSLPDSKKGIERFENVVAQSKAAKSPYKFVSDWFKAEYPNYKDKPVFFEAKLEVAETPDKAA